MEFLSTNDIIMWIDNWASNNPHPQKDDISLFAKNLNEQIAKMDYKVPNGGTVIGYAGKINENDGKTAIFHTVESAVKNNDGKLCFINNSAENILNNEEFKKSLKAAVKDYYDDIFGGKWVGNVRSKYSFGDNLSLSDFVSDNFMLNNAKGNNVGVRIYAVINGKTDFRRYLLWRLLKRLFLRQTRNCIILLKLRTS